MNLEYVVEYVDPWPGYMTVLALLNFINDRTRLLTLPFANTEVILKLKSCFPPVVNAQTRVLILGSLPGEASLAAQQYYAHPQNQFWRLLSAVLQVELGNLAYHDRLQTLLKYGIGLWDVLARAHRAGSLDSAIREKQYNDLQRLLADLPQLALAAFNGQTAGKAVVHLPATLPFYILPSSSPAYTLSFEAKKQQWLILRTYLG